jgi:hypothetical protein
VSIGGGFDAVTSSDLQQRAVITVKNHPPYFLSDATVFYCKILFISSQKYCSTRSVPISIIRYKWKGDRSLENFFFSRDCQMK